MLDVGEGSGATLPKRSVQRDWMAFILLGGAFWTPAMAAVSLVVASMILLVAVIFWDWDGMMLELECVGDPLAACVSHEDSHSNDSDFWHVISTTPCMHDSPTCVNNLVSCA